jgi:putative oxidoreductase
MMSMTADLSARRPGPVALYGRVTAMLGRTPESVMLLLLRIGVAMVFWKSGLLKLDDWNGTLFLFQNEYRVPILPTEVAAVLGTTAEIIGSAALIIGFGARFAALALIGLVGVIEFFVYPTLWPDHLFWFAALLIILVRGAGPISVDGLIARLLGTNRPE